MIYKISLDKSQISTQRSPIWRILTTGGIFYATIFIKSSIVKEPEFLWPMNCWKYSTRNYALWVGLPLFHADIYLQLSLESLYSYSQSIGFHIIPYRFKEIRFSTGVCSSSPLNHLSACLQQLSRPIYSGWGSWVTYSSRISSYRKSLSSR